MFVAFLVLRRKMARSVVRFCSMAELLVEFVLGKSMYNASFLPRDAMHPRY